ncbi:MAG: penicillin-binding protein 2 [Candidatus Daviesbacteria bacterium]|nr:penicillin-binding protein 2 [Candidatus Daviesbacteria bacterium]
MRLKLVKIIYYFFIFLIIVRLFYWQVIRFDDMSALAEKQHLTTSSISAPRGLILSEDGGIYATNKPVYTLFVNPLLLKDKKIVASQLAKIIVLSKNVSETDFKQALLTKQDELSNKLNQNLSWVALERNIELETKNSIEELKIPGLGFDESSARLYPEASSAANILGFVGSDKLGNPKGYFGIEGYYDRQLTGVRGEVTEEKDAGGLPILMGTFLQQESKKGYDLTLNIDRGVQYIVEKKLKAGLEKYGAKSGSVVIMEPKTGAILAMANYPNYDPNNYTNFSKEAFKNLVVADTYEPGSTFKTLIMAAGINENVVKPDTKCDTCDGPVTIGEYKIRTWDNKYRKDETMQDVLTQSDNTGMVFVGNKLGQDKLLNYIQKFGIGKLTQIDLEDEVSPDIRLKKDWKEIDYATATFGQGIAVTPIQMIRAVASIANGGYLVEPHVVKSINTKDKVTTIKPKIIGQPISRETAYTVTQMMVKAVDEGEAGSYAPKNYKIAGKTGTAQIPIAGHYDAARYVASFVGFAPADNPKFIMLVRYVEPTSSIYGTSTAAPTFFEIAKELFSYYQITPDR